jgi:hypothetical protein
MEGKQPANPVDAFTGDTAIARGPCDLNPDEPGFAKQALAGTVGRGGGLMTKDECPMTKD